jgi:hypothetical protein
MLTEFQSWAHDAQSEGGYTIAETKLEQVCVGRALELRAGWGRVWGGGAGWGARSNSIASRRKKDLLILCGKRVGQL